MFMASMTFDLGEEVNALREMVHRWAQERVKPLAAETDRTNAFPNELWREMGELVEGQDGLNGANGANGTPGPGCMDAAGAVVGGFWAPSVGAAGARPHGPCVIAMPIPAPSPMPMA